MNQELYIKEYPRASSEPGLPLEIEWKSKIEKKKYLKKADLKSS